jgi:hypothetical protein
MTPVHNGPRGYILGYRSPPPIEITRCPEDGERWGHATRAKGEATEPADPFALCARGDEVRTEVADVAMRCRGFVAMFRRSLVCLDYP